MCERCDQEEPERISVYTGPANLDEESLVLSPDGLHQEPWIKIFCAVCGKQGQVPARMAPDDDTIPVCPSCQREIEKSKMEDSQNFAFADLPSEAFPFTLKYYDVDTKEVYLTQTVDGPGALHVPPKPDHVREAGVTMTLATGEEHTFE